jgi:ATP-binding cassette subfamily B protein
MTATAISRPGMVIRRLTYATLDAGSPDRHFDVSSPDHVGRFRRLRAAYRLISALVVLHPRIFAIALTGGVSFAVATVASSLAIRWVIDNVIIVRFDQPPLAGSQLLIGLGLVVGIGLLRSVAVVVRRSFAGIFQWRTAESLSRSVAERYLRQPMTWFQGRSEGDLIARAGVDVEATVGVLAPIPFATGAVVLLALSTTWLLWTDLPIGIVALVAGPSLLWANVRYQRRAEGHFTAAQEHLGDFSGAVHESLDGVSLVKAYGAEERETRRLGELAAMVRESRISAIRLRATFEALLELVPALTNVALVVVGAIRISSGDLTIGQLTAAVFMFSLLVFPLRLIGYVLSDLPRSQAGFTRITEILTDDIMADPRQRITEAPAGYGVVATRITHSPGPEIPPTLTEVTLRVPVGQVLAVVGATGSGKTTLIEVLAGLRSCTGEISHASGGCAVVLQEAFLFAGSIRDNLCLGQSFSDEQITEALEWAAATEFVNELRHGIDTVVGERGVSLSGGQRQRVALARALVRQPAVLLADDVTSALDPSTEIAVLNNLRNNLGSTTVVMVASRPSTILLADQVAFIRDGVLVEQGAHSDLMERHRDYRAIVEAFETDRQRPNGATTSSAATSRGAR